MYSLEHTWSKAPSATLTLSSLQQWTQAASRFGEGNE